MSEAPQLLPLVRPTDGILQFAFCRMAFSRRSYGGAAFPKPLGDALNKCFDATLAVGKWYFGDDESKPSPAPCGAL